MGNPSGVTPQPSPVKDKVLKITLSREIHDLDYEGRVMGGWNWFCLTVGVAVALPGLSDVTRPAVWTVGGLGEAGYGARLGKLGASPDSLKRNFAKPDSIPSVVAVHR